ncbi:hypothetical protein DNH61_05850 [Paenibacillus sambharensis]|uniref:Uncharacterized protein n=1 Tax=Paenibacillus sambharensis TaxID=1803190 RepID=A0A2W1LF97_9BACL|nr:hypothetical protein DNH61_05850 [Paenibacillus sambharensis]
MHHIPCNFMYKSVIARIAQALFLRKYKLFDHSFNIFIVLIKVPSQKKMNHTGIINDYISVTARCKQDLTAGQWVGERYQA